MGRASSQQRSRGGRAPGEPLPAVLEVPPGGYLALGSDRWALWQVGEGLRVRVLIDTSRPRLAIVGVAFVVDRDQAPEATVRASDLRKVPLGRLESFLNGPGTAGWLRAALVEGSGPTMFDFSPEVERVPDEVRDIEPIPAPKSEFRIPGAHRRSKRPDDFYVNVAAALTRAIAEGHTNPADVLGAANNVPVRQVHSWVKQARRLGVLPPSSRATNAGGSGARRW